MYCLYYQAKMINKPMAWFISGCFRNEDHVAFVRALDKSGEVFEFFVPESQEPRFLSLMAALGKKGLVEIPEKKENRLKQILEPFLL